MTKMIKIHAFRTAVLFYHIVGVFSIAHVILICGIYFIEADGL